MKVLIVIDSFTNENYGVAIDCMNLIKYLKSHDDKVILLNPGVTDKTKMRYFYVEKINNDNITDAITQNNHVVLDTANEKAIKKLLNEVDIVHIMMPFPLGYKVAKIAKKIGVPISAGFHAQAESVTAHYHMMNVPFANAFTYKRFYKHLYKHANDIQYPTEFTKMMFEGAVKRRTNSYIISSGVNDIFTKLRVIRRGELKGKINILFIARFAKEKNHEILIKAVSLSKHKNEIQLVFTGQGSYKDEIINLAEQMKINPPLMKFVSREELVKIINSCDLYVHPAEAENEGISCLEAIACGLVPIISDSKKSAVASFALSEQNLFSHNSPQDLANKIDYWLEHPEEKKECSKQYLGFTESYTQRKCMRKMREMLLTYANEFNRNTNDKRYYVDEVNDDFAFNKIEVKKQKKPFLYVHKNPFWIAGGAFLYFIIARPLVWILNKLFFRMKVKNKYLLKRSKHTGYFIYCNHTNGMADAFTPNLLSPKRNHIVVGRETVSIKGIQNIVTMLGAIPIYADLREVEPYNECIKKRINQKRSITIYPEAHIWPYYTKIRRFKKDSFRYPVDMNKPVYVLTNTWQKRMLSKKPKLVSYLSGPLLPNPELSRSEAMDDLRERVYLEMCKISNSAKQIEKIQYIKVTK